MTRVAERYAEAAGEAAVVCRDVRFRAGTKEILSGVSLTVQPGEIAGVLGPNGAGKSTLFRILSGIVPPDAGWVRLFGRPAGVGTLSDTALLPDRSRLPGWLTVREWLGFAARIYPDWDPDRAAELVDHLQVPLESRISTLSRGQDARLQMLTCLARRARVVLLDEPFAGVDLVSRERIATSVVRELASGERACLIATHDVRELEQLFDRIVLLDRGRVMTEESVEALRARGISVEQRYREVFGA
ncbi:ABC transporter ATP-binding protein [Alicyclobacillus macrosporangiidus]|uniref:ABC-2 type transport system ATP-binding protein n=1 Tax=Alicyclobacillus macrosporangiidus TaxID=392015 RepID=A0A1I7HF74_9BACL|nr:ABC transporter ATP-binding protein [Alicyclobacillus macrosporangiidus]SFU59398.1 ABC-2 type transport system ATP-binding protein [Alicyclobacillus macrosporangiidus]